MKTKAQAQRQARQQKRTSAPLMADTAMPTAERLRHAAGSFQIGGDRRSGRIFRMLDAPLEQIFADKKLSDLQYESLRRLRMHWTLGQLAGSPQSIDYNRVARDWNGTAQSERELFHREMFGIGWQELGGLERSIVGAVVLSEIALSLAGALLGYRSPYRARVAALELLQASAGKLAAAWSL
jgi:hypothetical protein